MALIDMTLSKEEAKEESYLTSSDPDLPKYPWGLSLCLDDETMAKLGIALPAVGTELMIMAKVTVTGVRASQNQGGDSEQSCDLQITAMSVGPSAPAMSAAEKLYGSKT